jgi:P pilus assembly chaperone PapD
MQKRLYALYLLLVSVFFFVVPSQGGLKVLPNFLFLSAPKQSIAINVQNITDQDREGWIEIKYGYEVSDDSGKIVIRIDSSQETSNSIVPWVVAYPQRFRLKPQETQVIRLRVNPPADLPDGEYWARILITDKSASPAQTLKENSSGLVMLQQASVPLFYRIGALSTGVTLDSSYSIASDTMTTLVNTLTRTGNTSFLGLRKISVVDAQGNIVWSKVKNTGVFKTVTLRDSFSRRELPAGEYTVNYEFTTDRRNDIYARDQVKTRPIRISTTLIVPVK